MIGNSSQCAVAVAVRKKRFTKIVIWKNAEAACRIVLCSYEVNLNRGILKKELGRRSGSRVSTQNEREAYLEGRDNADLYLL